jgi:hypothetical protein
MNAPTHNGIDVPNASAELVFRTLKHFKPLDWIGNASSFLA